MRVRPQQYISNQTLPTECRGLTLIEVLIVSVIIALLAMILIPAVQKAREAARSVHCTSNLKQIGIAMHHYHAIHDMFPPSHLLTGRHTSRNRYSGFLFLLPFLEARTLYDSVNMAFCRQDSPYGLTLQNQTASTTRLSLFLCPSDDESIHRSTYRFNYGKIRVAGSSPPGPFAIGFIPSQASVTDGLTATAFVSERVGGTFNDSEDSIRNIKWVKVSTSQDLYDIDVFISKCVSSTTQSWNPFSGSYWMFNGMVNTDYNHAGAPNDRRPSCGGTDYGLQPPRSFHPGMVNVLFGDGRVNAVHNDVDIRLWRSLGTAQSSD